MQLIPPSGAFDSTSGARPRRGASVFGALAAVALACIAVISACGGDAPPAEECKGGIVIKGRCEGKCSPELCVTDNTCVDNRCVLQCTSNLDCYPISQQCLPATEDDTGKKIMTCQASHRAPFGTPCYFGQECEMHFKDDGTVAPLTYCTNGDQCDYSQCADQSPSTCTKNEEACEGIDDCIVGLCADKKTPCTVPACPQEDCQVMTCFSSGEGDAAAVCSRYDCTSDSECGDGFYCGLSRDGRQLCGEDAPDPDICGDSSDPCLDSSELGKYFVKGPQCLMRRACLVRRECDVCETDADCRFGTNGTKCVQSGPDKRCTKPCKQSSDCSPDHVCTDGLCFPRHKGAACIGDGGYCQPCDNDLDCGEPGSVKLCVTVYASMKACLDLEEISVPCVKNADCPIAESGLHGHCWGDNDGTETDDPAYHTCSTFPIDAKALASGMFPPASCW